MGRSRSLGQPDSSAVSDWAYAHAADQNANDSEIGGRAQEVVRQGGLGGAGRLAGHLQEHIHGSIQAAAVGLDTTRSAKRAATMGDGTISAAARAHTSRTRAMTSASMPGNMPCSVVVAAVALAPCMARRRRRGGAVSRTLCVCVPYRGGARHQNGDRRCLRRPGSDEASGEARGPAAGRRQLWRTTAPAACRLQQRQQIRACPPGRRPRRHCRTAHMLGTAACARRPRRPCTDQVDADALLLPLPLQLCHSARGDATSPTPGVCAPPCWAALVVLRGAARVHWCRRWPGRQRKITS